MNLAQKLKFTNFITIVKDNLSDPYNQTHPQLITGKSFDYP